MPEGDFRRPPQLWEQKIATLVAVNAVGSVSGGGTTEVGADLTPGDGGPPPDPDPIAPTPVAFLPPSTPTVAGTVQGIRVTWDGNNNAADAYPPDAFVEVHVSTTSGFTPSSSTLRGRLLGPGMFSVFGLTAGITYYARLVGVDAYGNTTNPSTQASSTTGLTTTGDYGTATIDAGAVSFNARTIGGITTTVGGTTPSSPVTGDIWLDSSSGAIIHKRWDGSAWVTQAWGSDSLSANCITAVQVAAGAITAGAIAANAVTADKINANAITADKIAASAITSDKIAANAITAAKIDATAIDGKTITGSVIRTSSGSTRAILGDGASATLDFYYFGTLRGFITGYSAGLSLYGNPDVNVLGNLDIDGTVTNDGAAQFGTSSGNKAIRIDSTGQVFSYGVDNATTANAANVRVGGSAQLLKSTSTARVKDELVPVTEDLAGVAPEKLADFPASIDPYDVLAVTPTEFRSLSPADDNARMFGFIAEDVAAKLPWAANWDDEGLPSAVEDRPILAALLAVVRDQQNTITDLTARVTALESA